MKFTKQEYADLHLLYGETRGNSRPARRPYGERFAEGVLPSRCTMAAKKFRPSFFRHFKKIGVVHSLLSL
jgi:hypothetical protein